MRKSTHIALGALAFILKYLRPPQHVVFIGIFALLAWILRAYHPVVSSMARPTELRDGVLWGVRYYFGTLLIVCLLFYNRPEITTATWLVLALGDGLSATVGGPSSKPVPWNRKKRLAGTFACLLGSLAGLLVALLWYDVPVSATTLFQAVALASMVAVIESIDSPLDDNLLIGLCTSVFVYLTGMFAF